MHLIYIKDDCTHTFQVVSSTGETKTTSLKQHCKKQGLTELVDFIRTIPKPAPSTDQYSVSNQSTEEEQTQQLNEDQTSDRQEEEQK